MKTDREWLLDTLTDAVADICWERMKQFPAGPDAGKNSLEGDTSHQRLRKL